MKKQILFLALVMTSLSGVFAQTETQENSKSKNPYEVKTNKFWNNWFISAGGGVQLFHGSDNDKANRGDRITPALDIAVGKWFTPGIGVRLVYSGLQLKGATANIDAPYSTGEMLKDNNYYKTKWDMMHLQADAMFNFSNMFCGYNEKRIYSFIPYAGAGLPHSWSSPKHNDWAFTIGLINRFRLCSALDLNIEVRETFMNNAFYNKGGKELTAATIGLTYKFKKRGWNVCSNISKGEMDDVLAKLAAMGAANEALQRALDEARNKKPETKIVKEKEYVGIAKLFVTFAFDKANVSKKDRVNLGYVAEAMKQNPDKVYTICGYADKQTGSAEYNEKLSKRRAEAVRDVLINEFGVKSSQLKIDYKGGVNNMFYDNANLSRAVIVE